MDVKSGYLDLVRQIGAAVIKCRLLGSRSSGCLGRTKVQQTGTFLADRSTNFERREIDEQLSRILRSPHFLASPVLQSFLRFIVSKAVDCMEDVLTEQLIATQVFSRDSNFDSSADTVVRTHAYRLRQKLREYYAGPGLADAILIDVPKGHYRPHFSRREDGIYLPVPDHPAETVPVPDRKKPRRRGVAMAAFVVFGITSLVAGMWLSKQMKFGERTSAAVESSPAEVQLDRFWSDFLGSDKSPIIAYSNDLYLTTESGNLLMFSGPTADRGTVASSEVARLGVPGFDLLRNAGPLYFEDDKTDIGEVMSSSVLTSQFVRMGVHPILKRGRVITTYDLESHNVIFLGSPFVNRILNQVEGNANFVFRGAPRTPSIWGGAIHNLHPLSGESRLYSLERDPKSRALQADYAVVSAQPGLAPSKKILVLAGITTSGTQAAAQFVTSPAGMEAMLTRLEQATHTRRWPSHFEYLLRVTLDHGLDVLRTECIASRTHSDPATDRR
jgi:hypothetical protein